MPGKKRIEISRDNTPWRLWVAAIVLGLCLVGANRPVEASPFTSIRIGDADGFGFSTASGYQAANGGSANVDGAGVLSVGDFLPDLNGDGKFDEKNGDSFDLRSPAELGGSALTGNGFTDQGSSGSQFTDITLAGKPQLATYTFDFLVHSNDIDPTTSVYFDLVFGDFDTGATTVDYTFADASTITQSVTKLGQGKANDGLIQNEYMTFAFSDIFTAVDGGYAGYLEVAFMSNDDFLTVDFAELGATNVASNPAGAPEPQTWVLLGVGLLGMLGYRWRMRNQVASTG
jgi:hypothetical protein